jgi:hypothetical protein
MWLEIRIGGSYEYRNVMLIRQVFDAIYRAQLDALWFVVKIDALDAGIRVNDVGVLTDAY